MQFSEEMIELYGKAAKGEMSCAEIAATVHKLPLWQATELAMMMQPGEFLNHEWAKTMTYSIESIVRERDFDPSVEASRFCAISALIWQGYTNIILDFDTPDIIKSEAGKYLAMEAETAIPKLLEIAESHVLDDQYYKRRLQDIIFCSLRPYRNNLGFCYSSILADYFGELFILKPEDRSWAEDQIDDLTGTNALLFNLAIFTHLSKEGADLSDVGKINIIKNDINAQYHNTVIETIHRMGLMKSTDFDSLFTKRERKINTTKTESGVKVILHEEAVKMGLYPDSADSIHKEEKL